MSDESTATTAGELEAIVYEAARANVGANVLNPYDILSAWLAEHDKQVAAKTLTDMADEWQAIEPIDSIGRFWRDIFAGKLRASVEQTGAK